MNATVKDVMSTRVSLVLRLADDAGPVAHHGLVNCYRVFRRAFKHGTA